MIKNVWAKEIDDYGGLSRVKVFYTKNEKDQVAVFMNYNLNGGRRFLCIEDNYYPRNRLSKKEQQEIGELLNNEQVIIAKKEQ